MPHTQLLIIGAGAAGMAAALAAHQELVSRQLLRDKPAFPPILMVDRSLHPGGVLRQCLHHGFGLTYFSENLTGIAYMNRFITQLEDSGVFFMPETSVTDISNNQTAHLTSPTWGTQSISFEHLILASGCYERSFASLAVPGSRPSGIFSAGEAQRLMNLCHKDIGTRIIILGSGDMGQILARQLSINDRNVLAVIEKEKHCGGLPQNRKACLEKYEIPVILSSTIEKVHGQERITGITIINHITDRQSFLPCDTLISAIGLIPEQKLLQNLYKNDKLPPWLTLCGNCDHVHKIVDTVTFQGEVAGRSAIRQIYNL